MNIDDALTTVIMGGDYEMADWWSIVEDLTDLQATDGDAGTRAYSHWGSGHPGVLVADEHDDMESRWVITDLDDADDALVAAGESNPRRASAPWLACTSTASTTPRSTVRLRRRPPARGTVSR